MALCTGVANTWFFNTTLTETAGTAVTLTSTVNVFDGTQTPEITGSIAIAARGSASVVNRQFCSSQSTQHTLQSTWRGTDAGGRAIVVSGPVVTLLAKP